jgi:hypothetical protein
MPMFKTHTKFAKCLRSRGKDGDEISAIKFSIHSLIVAEARVKSNAIYIKNIATKPLALGQLMAVGEHTGYMDEMLTSIPKILCRRIHHHC